MLCYRGIGIAGTAGIAGIAGATKTSARNDESAIQGSRDFE